ncbi:hypothetical protein [Caballeronia pedi]|nr:hypothetical protein [Caballeronia pedi]
MKSRQPNDESLRLLEKDEDDVDLPENGFIENEEELSRAACILVS